MYHAYGSTSFSLLLSVRWEEESGGVAEWDEEHGMLFVRNLKVPRTNHLDRSPSPR